MELETLIVLARLFLQTMGMSVLFVLIGKPLVFRLIPQCSVDSRPLGFVYGSAYFVGMAVFLATFVFLSRITDSAWMSLWLTLAGTLVLSCVVLVVSRQPYVAWQDRFVFGSSFLALVFYFLVTNLTLWMEPSLQGPSPTPGMMTHFGSIHSGRYANYSVFIAEHDRIPYIAQNMGQSILTSFHLLLGVNAPLAGLMIWIPFSLAALTCLIFGLFREQNLSIVHSLGATYFVLYCNIALSLVAVLVLDNGSPFGFAGYTDTIASIATFLLFAVWLRTLILRADLLGVWAPMLPLVMGLFWSWTAPQNIVIAVAGAGGVGLMRLARQHVERRRLLLRFLVSGIVLFASIGVGASQLGTFLDKSKREDIGAEVYDVSSDMRVRPFVLFVQTHWTDLSWNRVPCFWPETQHDTDIYANAYDAARAQGRLAVAVRWLALVETELWTGLRLYAFPLLGIVVMGVELLTGKASDDQPSRDSHRVWFWLALCSFATSFSIAFLLELGEIKWWLMRFLVPSTFICLIGLVSSLARLQRRPMRAARWAWVFCLTAGTFGPMMELSREFNNNWLRAAKVDPVSHRLNVLVNTTGQLN